MKVYLYRFKNFKNWQLGLLFFKSKKWFTAELPWINNLKNVSCIPDGIFNMFMQKHYSENGESYPAWEIIVEGRNDIELHKCNEPQQDSKGCICIGDDYNFKGITPTRSTPGYNDFMHATRLYKKLKIEIKTIHVKDKEIKMRGLKDAKFKEKLSEVSKDYELPEEPKIKISTLSRVRLFMHNRWKGFIGGGLLIGAGVSTGFLSTGLGVLGSTILTGEIGKEVGKKQTKYGKKGEFDIEEILDIIRDIFNLIFKKKG